jgi:hypothetical protein
MSGSSFRYSYNTALHLDKYKLFKELFLVIRNILFAVCSLYLLNLGEMTFGPFQT